MNLQVSSSSYWCQNYFVVLNHKTRLLTTNDLVQAVYKQPVINSEV